MTMAHGEKILRESGNPRDIAYADMLAAILVSRGEDIPLPETAPEVSGEMREAIGIHALASARFPGEVQEIEITSIEAPENNGELAAGIQEMAPVRAVVEAMYAKAPSEEENGRFGRQVRSVEWSWSHTRLGIADMPYDFELKYDTSKGNAPTQLEVIRGKEKGWGGITLVANQESRGLTELHARFSGADYKHAATFPGVEVNEKGTIIETPPFLGDYVREEYYPPVDLKVDINLEVNKLAVVISRKYTGGRDSIDTYIFNPGTNRFEGRRDEKSTLKDEEPKAFKELIENILALIPTQSS